MAKKTRKKTTKKTSSRKSTGQTAATTPRAAKRGAKAATVANAKPKATRGDDGAKTRKPSGLDLAAKVLADAGEPLAAKAIAERAIAAGWKTSGKTPHATLYAAIIREIAKKGDAARFKKVDRGTFAAAGLKGSSN